MLPKANIAKYSVVLIVIVIGAFFILKGQALSKIEETTKSTDTAPVINNESVAVNEPVAEKAQDTAPVAANTAMSKAEVLALAKRSELNNYVLKVLPAYEGSSYPYLLNDDYNNYNGVTENITYKGAIIAKANPDGSKSSHCVGLTYEVFFKAMQERNREAGISSDNFNNMNIDNMRDFLLTWYAAKGNPKSEGNQMAGAIVKYGLGTQITKLEEAKAGDFIDFSRTKSGHTAVFINWIRDDKDRIVGFKYWSTQESTNGIGYKVEYFSDNLQDAFKGAVNRSQLYIGRVGSISNYRSF